MMGLIRVANPAPVNANAWNMRGETHSGPGEGSRRKIKTNSATPAKRACKHRTILDST
jgi:hypothetical protein